MSVPTKTINNKQIAKNTIFLYIRMLFTMTVSLYTSRVVLATLGVEDYGIYGIVGSVVTMLSFLNSSMSGATSRFLTFEFGRGGELRLQKTFASALIVHIVIALIVLFLCETVGLWFLFNKVVIPENRIHAAYWVYQLSILSAMLGITQVPYNASIIAHEKMDVFAYIEIINVIVKLLIVYLLVISNYDKLISYAILMCVASFFIMMIYRLYCLKKFPECKFVWIWDKTYLKPLLSFSGWDLYGNLSCAVNQQGTNFLINMFFGVLYNAASGVANTVAGILRNLCNNVLMAFRPQIIKQYSIGNKHQSIILIYQASKFATTLLILVVVPFVFEIDYIMELWLKNPPQYASIFCKILLINSCFTMIEWALSIGVHATGNIRGISILGGTCFLLCVPLIWLFFRMGFPVEVAYLISIPTSILVIIVKSVYLKKYIQEFSYRSFALTVLFPLLLLFICVTSVIFLMTFFLEDGILRLFLMFVIDFLIGGLLTYYVILNSQQRLKIKRYITSQIRNK